jgi:hypothetical protein
MTTTVQPNETLIDVALRVYGSVQGLVYLAQDNGLKLDDEVMAGQELEVREGLVIQSLSPIQRSLNVPSKVLYEVLPRQSFLDLAIQLGGGVTALTDLLKQNGAGFEDVLLSRNVKYPLVVDQQVFKKLDGKVIATQAVPDEIPVDRTGWLGIKIDTTNAGLSNSNQFTLPLRSGFTYDFEVDKGEGGVEQITTDASPIFTFNTEGVYTIYINCRDGQFPTLFFNNSGDRQKVLEVVQWGDFAPTTLDRSWHGCSNLRITAVDAPNLSGCTSMFAVFSGCLSLTGGLANWDVRTITNLGFAFFDCPNYNESLNGWDTALVTTMTHTFYLCRRFSGNVSAWDLSSCTNTSAMFFGCLVFNSNISAWDMSRVTDANRMLTGCSVFNHPIGLWDTSAMRNMSRLLEGCTAFNHDLRTWVTDSATNMSRLFFAASSYNYSISMWNTSSVTNMGDMFYLATSFDQSLGGLDITSVTTFGNNFMFGAGLSVTNYDSTLNGWASQAVGIGLYLFAGSSQYSDAGEASRDYLTGVKGWGINDNGKV